MARYLFGTTQRIRSESDFRAIFDLRQSAADGRFVCYVRATNGPRRLGLSVSRRVGNAVCRNRWKRLCREAFRLRQHELPANVEVILIARGTTPPMLADVEHSLVQLVRRVTRRQQSPPRKDERRSTT
jgi:ribonuclease P protein component